MGLHPADFHIVKGQIESAGVLDQPVIADNRDAFVGGGVDCRTDGCTVLCEDDQRVNALRDEAFHIRELLGRRALSVRRNICRTGGFECGFDRRLIRLPAFFLKIRPADPDGRGVAVGNCRCRKASEYDRGCGECFAH